MVSGDKKKKKKMCRLDVTGHTAEVNFSCTEEIVVPASFCFFLLTFSVFFSGGIFMEGCDQVNA